MIQAIVTDLLVLLLMGKKPDLKINQSAPITMAVPRPAPGDEVPKTEYQVLLLSDGDNTQNHVADPIIADAYIRQLVINRPAPQEIELMINNYAAQLGVDAGKMKTIASCESGYNPGAVNGPYGGMYQFLASTWSSNRRAMGLDPNPDLRFNAEEAIKTSAFKMSRDGYGAWPVCSQV